MTPSGSWAHLGGESGGEPLVCHHANKFRTRQRTAADGSASVLTYDGVFAFLLLILAAMHMTATGLSCGTELPLNPKFCNE